MYRDADTHCHPRRRNLFQGLQIDLVRLVGAAVFGGVGQTEQAGPGEQGEDLSREVPGAFLLGRVRGDLVLRDVADERDQVPGLLRGQLPVHRLRGAVGHGDALLPVGR